MTKKKERKTGAAPNGLAHIQPGDTVSLSAAPTINLGKYESLRLHASISRQVGEDPIQDIRDMEQAVEALVLRDLAVNVGAYKQTVELIDSADAEDTEELCAVLREKIQMTVEPPHGNS